MKTEDKTKQKAESRQERLQVLDHTCVSHTISGVTPPPSALFSLGRLELGMVRAKLAAPGHMPPVLPINANVCINSNFMPKKKL